MSVALLRTTLDAGYGRQTQLHQVHLELASGDRMGLLGTSGAGKSTLILALLGLLPQRGGWARGEVLLEGRNLLAMSHREARSLRGRELALVPQSSTAALNPALTLQRHFEQAWRAHRAADPGRLQHRLEELFERIVLPSTREFLARKPGQISVGQAQRCTLALALLHRPKVILADEPTSALDPLTQREITQLLLEVCRDWGSALLFVSHDLLSVIHLCNYAAVLDNGAIQARAPLQSLATTAQPWLQQLLATLPVPLEVLLASRNTQLRGTKVTQNGPLPTPSS